MSNADLISRERLFDGKVFDVDRDEVRAAARPHGEDGCRASPQVGRARPGPRDRTRDPDPAVPSRGETVAVGAPSRSGTRGSRRSRRRRGSVTRNRAVAGHRGQARRALPNPRYCDEEMVFFRLSSFSTPEEPAEVDEDGGHRGADLRVTGGPRP